MPTSPMANGITPDNGQAFLKAKMPEARRFVRASVFFACLNAAAMIAAAWVFSGLVRDLAFHHAAQNAIAPGLILLAALYAARALLSFLADDHAARGALAVKSAVRRDMLRTLLARGPAKLSEDTSGGIINAYVEGVEALHGYYALTLPARVTAALIPLAIFFFVLPADWMSALVLIVTAPLIPVFMIWIGRGAEALNQKQWRRMTFMSGHFLDAIQGLSTLKLFNAGKREAAAIRRIADDFRVDTMEVLRVAFLSSLALEFFATVSIAMIAVLIGFRLLWHEVDFRAGFFVLLLAPEFYLPLRRMGTHYHAKMEAVAAAETLAPLMENPAGATGAPFAADGVSVRFEAVTFAYPGRAPVLRNTTFSIQPGETVALAGLSGAGKSTIILLLLGFLAPQAGRIFINEIPLDALNPESWRRGLSWLPQRPRLFGGTVENNIRLAAPDSPNTRINRLIDDCGIRPLAANPVGENGAGLSGGQIQRVALARALLRGSPLLLLDEPTAHLDPETESLVHAALQRHKGNATVLFAAHREASLALADRVLTIANGGVLETKRRAA